ncbi:MAG TPA: substrate-binding domain-containing protein, partial [Candidatus Limnocylindrales bacterium]
MLNGTRRFGALAIAAAMLAAACSSAATPSPTTAPPVTPAPTIAPTATMNTSTPAPATPTPAPTVNCVAGSITEAGSTALQPLIQDAATAYQGHCPGATITVTGGGSGTGLSQVAGGSVQIGASDVLANTKLATPVADTLVDHVVCRQGWIVVTNLDVTGVTNLTTQQNIDIW